MRFHVLIMVDKHASLLKLNTKERKKKELKQKQISNIMKENDRNEQHYENKKEVACI